MVTSPLLKAAARAPRACLDRVAGDGTVLLLAPHPDDETLGCGAALAALAAAGRKAQVVLLTDGAASHPRSRRCPPRKMAAMRARELREALRILGQGRLDAPVCLGLPDGAALRDGPQFAAALARLRSLLSERITAIWATWDGDPHCDHQHTARLARRLAENVPGARLWLYPIWGRFAAEAAPPAEMVRLAPGRHVALKRRAVAAHRSQMTRLVGDDPTGFVMRPAHQAHFIDYDELFIPVHT
jgi:LmbE family N-acetylglucosaminyl deacetylase